MERSVNANSAAVSPTRKMAVTHCVTVLLTGLPKAVRQADDVWTSDCVTDDTAIILIRDIKSFFSVAASDPNMSLVASGAKIYSTTAAGNATASVIASDLYAFLRAPSMSPLSARGEICGTDEAASP